MVSYTDFDAWFEHLVSWKNTGTTLRMIQPKGKQHNKRAPATSATGNLPQSA